MRTGPGYAIANAQGTGRFVDQLAAFVRDGPGARRQGRHDFPSVRRTPVRVVGFSDAVFAITVTLLVLGIKRPTDYIHLAHGLLVSFSTASHSTRRP
jgi:Endosomal/lysosomal potassium channel TMEM175